MSIILGGGNLYHRLMSYYYYLRHAHLWSLTGIELHPNVAEPGLHIVHGKVVINANAHIGKNCKIFSDVTIGWNGSFDSKGAPIIGDRVFIGTGAKIIGDIRIANDVVIGANAVVTKDITEPGTTWVGIPARKINNQGSAAYLRLP